MSIMDIVDREYFANLTEEEKMVEILMLLQDIKKLLCSIHLNKS